MATSLYERLGGTAGIEAIAKDLVANHLANAKINSRYTSDPEEIANGAATFFIQGIVFLIDSSLSPISPSA